MPWSTSQNRRECPQKRRSPHPAGFPVRRPARHAGAQAACLAVLLATLALASPGCQNYLQDATRYPYQGPLHDSRTNLVEKPTFDPPRTNTLPAPAVLPAPDALPPHPGE
jgi:hypothetical protein